MPIERVRDLSWAEDGSIREELPKDRTIDFFDVLITADITGVGGGTPLEAYNIVDRFELLANGKPLYDLSGLQLYNLNASLQGERYETLISDPSGGTTQLSLLLRIWMTDPTVKNTRRGELNLRDLEQYSVRISFNAVTDIFTGGTQALSNNRMRIYYNETPGIGGDVVTVNRTFEYVLTGARQIIEWKERSAVLKSMLFTLFDDSSPPALTDDGLDIVGLRVDGKDPIIDEVPYSYIRTGTTVMTGLDAAEIDTGVAYYDLDPGSKGLALQSLDGVNVEVQLQGTVDFLFQIVRREYLPLEVYLGGRGRSQATGGVIAARRGARTRRRAFMFGR